MSPEPMMEFDGDGVRRVARVLLKHVRPGSREEARSILEGRLGGYASDQNMLEYEIDRYFVLLENRAA